MLRVAWALLRSGWDSGFGAGVIRGVIGGSGGVAAGNNNDDDGDDDEIPSGSSSGSSKPGSESISLGDKFDYAFKNGIFAPQEGRREGG